MVSIKALLAIPGSIALGLILAVAVIAAAGVQPDPAFRTYLAHTQPRCGGPVAPAGWHGAVLRQRFKRCTLQASFQVIRKETPTRTPTPTATPPPPTVTPRPSSSATPWPAPWPTATPVPADPLHALLALINTTRAQYGVPPLALDTVDSSGNASCAGAEGHNQAMIASGTIWHINPQYPAQSFPQNLCSGYTAAGQNVGMGGSAAQIHAAMMSEPHDAATCAQGINHACNILSGRYDHIGLAVDQANGYVWITEDFLG